MSDQPSSPPNTQDAFDSGWHKPSKPTAWRTPEPQEAGEGWVTKALPEELEQEPEERGEWHLPRPEDTEFTKDTELEVKSQPASDLRPEDLLDYVRESDGELDVMSPEDDDDFFSMSELVTLANLRVADEQAATEETTDEDEVGLSPAERAVLHMGSTDLQATVPLDPREAALRDKFLKTQSAVEELRRQYRSGQMSYDDLQTRLRDHMVLDNDDVWWMMGVETEDWYKYQDSEWIRATPPVLINRRLGGPPTETGQLDPDEVIAGALPQLNRIDEPVVQPNIPVRDPQATVVSDFAFDNTLATPAEPTFQNVEQVDPQQTVRTPAVREYDEYDQPVVESAYTTTETTSSVYEQYAEDERRSTLRTVMLIVGGLLALGIICMICFLVSSIIWFNSIVGPYQDAIDGLADYEPEFATARLYDANGDLIVELNSTEGARIPVTLDEISPFMIHAVISQEDERYYENPGYDPIAIARAFLQNILGGTIESGASTITQQVASMLVLNTAEPTIDVKITEAMVAQEIARQYDKNFVLQLYLNEINLGNQSYGVEAASRFYFDKPSAQLNMAESAMIAQIIPAPALREPVSNHEQAMIGMHATVNKMIEVDCLQFQHGTYPETGPFCINGDTRVNGQVLLVLDDNGNIVGGLVLVQMADVEATQYLPREYDIPYPHFVNYVVGEVEEIYGSNAMFQQGFNVYTTLIPRVQDVAQASVTNRVAQLVNNGVNNGAAMVTDPNTGNIWAMVGSADFYDEANAGQINYTLAYNQPGSSIKPVVYTSSLTGLPDGRYFTPATILWDVPSAYNINGQIYEPVNFSGTYAGPVPVRTALQNSLNVPAVKTYAFIGNEGFVSMAEAMGINFLPDAVFSLPSALGANEVRLIDMMSAYGSLAAYGRRVPLTSFTRITAMVDGVEVDVPIPEPLVLPTQAVSPQVSFLMQSILSDDPARAPQFPTNSTLTLANIGVPTSNFVAAKTGTNNDGSDLWTMGFTQDVVVGVWLGTHQDAPTFGVTGFSAASPVWNQIMTEAVSGRGVQPFQNPGGVVVTTVCATTGTLPGPECTRPVNELFVQNQPPPPASDGYLQVVNIDSWTGLRANQWCPDNVIEEVFSNIDDPFAVDWINNTAAGNQWAAQNGVPIPLRQAPTEECSQSTGVPIVVLASPTTNETLSEEANIIGQVSATNFASYTLEYAPLENPENFTVIMSSASQQPNPNSLLGLWDTRTVPNGRYIFRLQVNSQTGGFIERTVSVSVANIAPTPTLTPTFIPLPTAQPPIVITIPPAFTPLPFDTITPSGP